MKSLIGFVGVLCSAVMACGQTASTSVTDASSAVDVVDVVDAVDAVDAPRPDVMADVSDATDVMDVSDATDVMDVSDATDVMDVPRPDVPADAPVDTGVRCGVRETACASGGALVCVDVQSDPRHCGACGRACCVGQWCAAGSCVTGCPTGQTLCTPPGATCPICADTFTSHANCGRCNSACAEGQLCVRGECAAPTCAAVTEPLPPMGQCDGRGRIACERWAQDIAGGRPNVTAQCLTSPSGCAKADHCDDPRDASTCRCGAEPSCGANQVCELVGPTARCRCARL